MSLIRWRKATAPTLPMLPTHGTLHDEMNRLFEDFLGPWHEGHATTAAAFWPALDVSETGETLTVKAELPGMSAEEIDIDLTGDTLTLKGEKQLEPDDEGETHHHVERLRGSFTRTVRLPDTIDPQQVDASYAAGVLTVKIGKKESTKPRRIEVKTV